MIDEPELKFKDVDINDATVGQAGVVTAVMGVGQGITDSARIGRKLTFKHVSWRISLNTIATADTNVSGGDIVRLMLVMDTQPNGATVATAAEILQVDNFQSYNNLNRKGRFRVLWDKTVAVNALMAAGNGTANDTGTTFVHLEVYRKLDTPVEYSGVAGATSEIQTNSLLTLVLSSVGERINMDSKMRLRFHG